MSAPQALRLAIEACRPTRSSALRLRPLLQTRTLTQGPYLQARRDDRDITKGFPMPESDPTHDAVAQDGPYSIPESLPASTPEEVVTRKSKTKPTSNAPGHVASAKEPAATAVPSGASSTSSPETSSETNQQSEKPSEPEKPKMHPPNVIAAYLAPMRHQPTDGIPVASLQLASYSIRNLEFFADFCMRAAFYLKMPARGPVPLPRRTERWTTLRSNFVHKKSQENFERITYKRLITIMDADKSAVEAWLAYVRKWQFYGVGMKANVWEFEGVDVAKNMDKEFNEEISKDLDQKLSLYGWNKEMGKQATVQNLLQHNRERGNTVGSPMTDLRSRAKSQSMEEKSYGIGA